MTIELTDAGRTEYAALVRDARRYRYLREHLLNWCPDDLSASLDWSRWGVLDARVDAAMEAAK